jgi:hypothetical protein
MTWSLGPRVEQTDDGQSKSTGTGFLVLELRRCKATSRRLAAAAVVPLVQQVEQIVQAATVRWCECDG